MATIYTLDNVPLLKSWIGELSGPEAVEQCQAFNILPAATLALNRKLLRRFMDQHIASRGGNISPQSPESLIDLELRPPFLQTGFSASPRPDALFGELRMAGTTDCSLPRLTQHVPHYQSASYRNEGPFTCAVATATGTRPTASESSVSRSGVATVAVTNSVGGMAYSWPSVSGPAQAGCPPVTKDCQPSLPFSVHQFSDVIRETAVAVGEQMAKVFAQNQPPSRVFKDDHPTVLSDLVRGVAIASGSDAAALVKFLAQVNKIATLRVAGQDSLLCALLGRTSGQLRTFWSQAIADRMPIHELTERLMHFFVPQQLRHVLVTQLVYRSQRDQESIPEYVDDLRTHADLLLPSFADEDLLDVALHGLNALTRSRMAALPSPTSLDALLALAPRVELVKRMEANTVRPEGTEDQSFPHFSTRQDVRQEISHSSPAYNHHRYRDEPPWRRSQQSSFQRRQSYAPRIPPFPFRELQPAHNNPHRPQNSSPRNNGRFQAPLRPTGQLNPRGGQRS